MKFLIILILFVLPTFSQVNLPETKWKAYFGKAKKEITKDNTRTYIWHWKRNKATHYVAEAVFNSVKQPIVVAYHINKPGWVWDSNVVIPEKEIMALLKLNKKHWKAVAWNVDDVGRPFAKKRAVYWIGGKKILARYIAEDRKLTLFNVAYFEQEQKHINAQIKAAAKKPAPVKSKPVKAKVKAKTTHKGKK